MITFPRPSDESLNTLQRAAKKEGACALGLLCLKRLRNIPVGAPVRLTAARREYLYWALDCTPQCFLEHPDLLNAARHVAQQDKLVGSAFRVCCGYDA